MIVSDAEYWNTIQDRASIGTGITSSPCRTCPHFGTPPYICRDYPDCPLNHREPVDSMRNSPPNKRGRGKASIKRDNKILKMVNDGVPYAQIAAVFKIRPNVVAEVVYRARARGEHVIHVKPGPKGKP